MMVVLSLWVRRSSGRLSAANGNWGATTSLSVGGGEGHADTLGGKLEVEELPDKEAAEERRAASLSSHLTTRISSGVEAEGATAGLGIRDDCMRRERMVAMRLARRRRPATSACHAEKASARGSNPGLPWRAEGASVASGKGAGPGFARVIPEVVGDGGEDVRGVGTEGEERGYRSCNVQRWLRQH